MDPDDRATAGAVVSEAVHGENSRVTSRDAQ